MTFLLFQTVLLVNLMNGLVFAAPEVGRTEVGRMIDCWVLETGDTTTGAMRRNIADQFPQQSRWNKLISSFKAVPATTHLEMFVKNTLEAVRAAREQSATEVVSVDRLLLYLGRKQRVLDDPSFRRIDLRNKVKDDRGTLKREQATEQMKYIRSVAEYNLASRFLNEFAQDVKLEIRPEVELFNTHFESALQNLTSYHGYRLGIERTTPSAFPSATATEAIELYRKAAVLEAQQAFQMAQDEFMVVARDLKSIGTVINKRPLLTWEYNLARALLLFELLDGEGMSRRYFPNYFGDASVSNTLRVLAIYRSRLARTGPIVSVITEGERFIGPMAPKADIPVPTPQDIRRWSKNQDVFDKEADRAEINRQLEDLDAYLTYLVHGEEF